MVLNEITLHNFRNFIKATYSFAPLTSVVYGQNGSGKSNLLEAIYLLSTGGSLRARSEIEMVNEASDFTTASGTLLEFSNSQSTARSSLKLEVTLIKEMESAVLNDRARKRFKVSGIPRRRKDFAGKLRAVLFNPEQISLVNDEPSYRRTYLDLVLAQTDATYTNALIVYDRARIQRNKLLYQIKVEGANVNELSYWEGVLSEFGIIVSDARWQFINYVNEYLITNVNRFGSGGYFTLVYQPSIVSRDRFDQYRSREIQAERTLIGPHRDDFYFEYVMGDTHRQNLRHYGSRGQQRLAVFALKMAEWQFLKETGTAPIFLLDDIFSELDERHREIILSTLDGQQAILTTTEKNVVTSILKGYPVISLDGR